MGDTRRDELCARVRGEVRRALRFTGYGGTGRRPGVVGTARALADSCGLAADVELNALTTAVRFSRIPTILN
jgi:hypothetical protein